MTEGAIYRLPSSSHQALKSKLKQGFQGNESVHMSKAPFEKSPGTYRAPLKKRSVNSTDTLLMKRV